MLTRARRIKLKKKKQTRKRRKKSKRHMKTFEDVRRFTSLTRRVKLTKISEFDSTTHLRHSTEAFFTFVLKSDSFI